MKFFNSDFKKKWYLLRDLIDSNAENESMLKLIGDIIRELNDIANNPKYLTLKLNIEELVVYLKDITYYVEYFLKAKSDISNKKELKSHFRAINDRFSVAEKIIKDIYEGGFRFDRRAFLNRSIKVTAAAVISAIALKQITKKLLEDITFLTTVLPLKKNDGLAILISKDFNDKVLGKITYSAYIARVELAFGQRANRIINNAVSGDFFDVLKDDSIQNIALSGHGTWSIWVASDREVKSEELFRLGNKKKTGYLMRHTCGGGRGIYSKELILLNDNIEEWVEIKNLIKNINKKLSSVKSNGYVVMKIVKGENIKDFYNEVKIIWNAGIYVQIVLQARNIVYNDNRKIEKLEVRYNGQSEESIKKGLAFVKLSEEFAELLRFCEAYSDVYIKNYELDYIPQFGTPVFIKSKIKGWDRPVSIADTFRKPFGDEKLDKLYYLR